ncbi:uncharacterized protein LOC111621353 isoform X2 [Centruroides sculpturatus]|uniref:uncharacterized protein LOC111621353 isoform X2 n=2 Tax=Centruroides sculpturatus TaxID=218467 RepID=UPI000C6E26AC|nr:uncharacterized protein LOC111621353 isoform X2 [Centruroides sculpturatus]
MMPMIVVLSFFTFLGGMWSIVQTGSVNNQGAPSSRSKHAMCSTQTGMIYLLGGRSANLPLKDFWRFDPVQSLWEELRCRGNRPPCLQEHTMVGWRHFLYVFGGEIGFASTGETPLWILDTGVGTWRKHHIRGLSGQQPSGRRGHTSVVYNGAMHVYGGYQDLRGSSSELWSFDFVTERWHLTLLPSHVDQPPARHNHSSVVHDAAMWVYGGMTDLQERNDFWKWDFVSKQWSRIRSQKGPGELHGHSAVKAMSCMYIFGGERAGVLLNELWRYHFATETWERLQPEGVIPNPRCRHAAVIEPTLHTWDDKIIAWENSPQQSNTTRSNHSHHRHSHPVGTSDTPPKSASMCFTQSESAENGRKYFKFRVHPVSRLCSKSTSSDDEDEDSEYVAAYNHNSAQVNISKSLREKITSSRLVRSISSGSYSILHNPPVEGHADELERLVEETPHQQHRTIQKSHSSDAVLESDSETSTPQHTRPKLERLPSPGTNHPRSFHPTTPTGSIRTSESQKEKSSNGDWCCCYHGSSNSLRMMGHTHCDVCHRMVPQSAGSRGGRLAYDGPLTTVKDVEEETSEGGDEAVPVPVTTPKSMDAVLVDLDTTYPMETEKPRQHPSSYTLSDLVTPSVESCGLSHSVSHSSGYHSFTDDESGDCHREFAGCLNITSRRPSTRGHRDGLPVELKTFNNSSEPPRARSWDRSSQRKHQIRNHPITPTPTSSSLRLEHQMASVSPGRRWHLSPSKPRIQQRHWQLCLYVFGGREQGAPGVYRQPISVWKLH